MTDAGYVIAGWSLTGVVLGAYTFLLAARIRRARRSMSGPGGDQSR